MARSIEKRRVSGKRVRGPLKFREEKKARGQKCLQKGSALHGGEP